MFSARLYVFAVLAASWSATASPISPPGNSQGTMPFSLMFGNMTTTLPDRDRARAAALKNVAATHAKRDFPIQDVIVPANNSFVTYTTNVGVGTPPTNYTLLIDTGSSNTWVGAGKQFQKTSSTMETGNFVEVIYGSGQFAGYEIEDTIILSENLVITNQSIGVAKTARGFNGVDGILGIGPTELTEGTLFPAIFSEIPTVTDNLFKQGKIAADSIAISFEPINTTETLLNGELTFGQLDYGKVAGPIYTFNRTTTSPASNYFGIDQSITYGSSGVQILNTTAGIVDTGTTLTLIATDAFNAYKQATGAVLDEATGLLTITYDQYENLQTLKFTVSGVDFELIPNAQIWPRELNTFLGGEAGKIYLIIADLGSNSGRGLDFINGYTFLERFYSVYTPTQVGLAVTPHTKDIIN